MKTKFPQYFDFVVIDDSKLDLIIAQKMLKRLNEDLEVKTFEHASSALDFISDRSPLSPHRRTVLLIDLRMPLMDGFQFCEHFSQLPETVQQQYIPCILTSSIAQSDRNRAESMPVIHAFLNKPPETAALEQVLERYLQEHLLTMPADE